MVNLTPSRVALVTGAAAVVLAACSTSTDEGASSLTSPRLPAQDIGIAAAGISQVCVHQGSPGAIYHFALTDPQNFQAGDAVGVSPASINTGAPGPICRDVLTKADKNDLTIASIHVGASTALAGTFSYACIDDAGDGLRCSSASGNSGAMRAGASGPHGSTVTFRFEPAPQAMFVIGDGQIHDIGSTIDFWGSQWSAKNSMSGSVANGAAAFKGYAGTADMFCGGSWSARGGNSTPPPASIPTRIAVIVTSSIDKKGSDLSGKIKKILLVDQDGSYGASPGKSGKGIVADIGCQE